MHEFETGSGRHREELAFESADVIFEACREVGIERGAFRAWHETWQWQTLVRGDDLGEASSLCELRETLLVLRMTPAVQQHDGYGLETALASGGEAVGGSRFIERFDHRAVDGDPFIDFENLGMQRPRSPYVQGKDIGACLMTNDDGVTETTRDHEQQLAAATFEQRVGHHRGADAHRAEIIGCGAGVTQD